MKRIDLSGIVVGRLTVVVAARGGQAGRQHGWRCRCECGRDCWRSASALNIARKRNHEASCGTCRSDLTGRIFGRLTVVGPSDAPRNSSGHRLYRCVCTCGVQKLVDGTKLINRHTQSCGCRRVMSDKMRHRKPAGVAAQNRVIWQYRSNAKMKGVTFELSRERAIDLFSGDCWYCGAPPSRPADEIFLYNGIDRIDNDRGYIEGNVVSCCTACNFKKGRQSYDEFVAWIVRAAACVSSRDPSFIRPTQQAS